MKYVVEKFYEKADVTIETNDIEIAILEMISCDENGTLAQCYDNETYEFFARVNDPDGENYCSPEFALMILGMLLKKLLTN